MQPQRSHTHTHRKCLKKQEACPPSLPEAPNLFMTACTIHMTQANEKREARHTRKREKEQAAPQAEKERRSSHSTYTEHRRRNKQVEAPPSQQNIRKDNRRHTAHNEPCLFCLLGVCVVHNGKPLLQLAFGQTNAPPPMPPNAHHPLRAFLHHTHGRKAGFRFQVFRCACFRSVLYDSEEMRQRRDEDTGMHASQCRCR